VRFYRLPSRRRHRFFLSDFTEPRLFSYALVRIADAGRKNNSSDNRDYLLFITLPLRRTLMEMALAAKLSAQESSPPPSLAVGSSCACHYFYAAGFFFRAWAVLIFSETIFCRKARCSLPPVGRLFFFYGLLLFELGCSCQFRDVYEPSGSNVASSICSTPLGNSPSRLLSLFRRIA